MSVKCNGTGVWLAGALIVAVILSGAMGCRRTGPKPMWPAAGFTAPVNGASFRLDLQPRVTGTFAQVLSIASRRPDVSLFFSTDAHVLELHVFREGGGEVAPSVVRPDVKAVRFTVAEHGSDGLLTIPWPSPPCTDAKYRLEDGTRVEFGKHTLDVWTRAWDLAPGKYTVRARFRSKSAVEEPYGKGYETTDKEGKRAAVYWAGDVELTPVEIEVAE